MFNVRRITCAETHKVGDQVQLGAKIYTVILIEYFGDEVLYIVEFKEK